MQVTLVHVHVKAERLQEFLAITRENHECSIREPGNRRFDILQSKDDPNYFVLYEAYADAQAAAAHKETSHYKKWRETVADWMAEPRKGVPFTGLWPA